jgi:hypothetical protein
VNANANAWHSPTDLLGDMPQRVAVREMIGARQNFHPHFHVIAMTEDRAWIRDIQHGTDHVIPFDRYRTIKVGGE